MYQPGSLVTRMCVKKSMKCCRNHQLLSLYADSYLLSLLGLRGPRDLEVRRRLSVASVKLIR